MVLSMKRWKGKVAIVTGASSGIGAAIAEKLVNDGLKVVGLARRVERVKELSKKLSSKSGLFSCKSGKLYAVKADISKEEDILKAFKWVTKNVGPVHILVNNAGVTQPTTLIDGDADMWKTIFDTNVLGLCVATREAVKIMKANQIDGHIVHINSVLGHEVLNHPGLNAYPASKFAVTALTETLRQELNQSGSKIKISSVSPGGVRTEFSNNSNISGFDLGGKSLEEFKEEMLKNVRWLHADDVAQGVLYVLSTPSHVQVHELTIRAVEA